MLNKDALRRWAEKLEDGRFRQGKSYLKETDLDGENADWCCVGVACIQADEDGWPLIEIIYQEDWEVDALVTEWRDGSKENGGYGPASLGDYFGIPQDDRTPPSLVAMKMASNRLINAHGLAKYIRMNDRGETFAAIAAEIRKDFDL